MSHQIKNPRNPNGLRGFFFICFSYILRLKSNFWKLTVLTSRANFDALKVTQHLESRPICARSAISWILPLTVTGEGVRCIRHLHLYPSNGLGKAESAAWRNSVFWS